MRIGIALVVLGAAGAPLGCDGGSLALPSTDLTGSADAAAPQDGGGGDRAASMDGATPTDGASGIDSALDDAAPAFDLALLDLAGPADAPAVADLAIPLDAAALPDAAAVKDLAAPPDLACAPKCLGRECGANGCGGTCGACPNGQGCGGSGQCTCATPVEVVIYDEAAWNVLADAFKKDPSPCAHYHLSIPAVADGNGEKTVPRGGEAAKMQARGPRFHALAEFHWASWSQVQNMTWFEKGVEFRKRMQTAGYDVTAGDGWAVNELPSTVRYDATTRKNARDAVRGLATGQNGAPVARGAVFTIGMGQPTVNLGPYKANIEDWLKDAAFWSDMSLYARFWGQEVYASPSISCVPNTTVAARSTATNEFVEHVARLAAAGPNAAASASAYLDMAYVPLMNAAWRAPAYDTMISLDQMQHFVSGQVYAARAWAGTHPYPGGRIAFAWTRSVNVTDGELDILGARMASAIHHAYDAGGGAAAGACSPNNAFTWCQCSVQGAAFNDAWQTFAAW
ncbi:MAG: hypothetical protein EXR72_06050 [Myxococcales bacterium]|nr:hypothetical protein [Myxococcales bacterium]